MDYQEYIAYLKSSEWKAKRKMAIQHFGYKCAKCGMSGGQPNCYLVCHKSFARIGEETLDDLEVLCQECARLRRRR